MISQLQPVLYTLLLVSVFGYVFVVIKEKILLRNNTIVIDKKAVTEECLQEADIKIFALGEDHIKSGDEVKLVLHGNKRLYGIVIGAKKKENAILLVTHNDKLERIEVTSIRKFKIVSKYGKFFR